MVGVGKRIAGLSNVILGKSIEKLAIVYKNPLIEKSQIVDVLGENTAPEMVLKNYCDLSFLEWSRSYSSLLDFQRYPSCTTKKPLMRNRFNWRAIFAGGVDHYRFVIWPLQWLSYPNASRAIRRQMKWTRHNQVIFVKSSKYQAGLVTWFKNHKILNRLILLWKVVGQPLARLWFGHPLNVLFQFDKPRIETGIVIFPLMIFSKPLMIWGIKRANKRRALVLFRSTPVPCEMTLVRIADLPLIALVIWDVFTIMTERKTLRARKLLKLELNSRSELRERTFELEGANTRLA